MKKFFKIIGFILLLLIVFVLVAGIFVRKDYHLERSITINAPKEKVWTEVSTLANINKWNPWLKQDPTTKGTYEGEDGRVGATYRWDSEKIGKGSQTLTKLDAPGHTESHMHFIKPFEGVADAFMDLKEEGSGTKVTWGFDTHYAYPKNVMLLFVNMDKMMGESYDDGLGQLKTLSEAN